jgi:hypothetical protein
MGLGDVESAFKRADVIVERRFSSPAVHQGYIEPHACVAEWTEDGRSLYIYRPGELPARVFVLSVETGRRTPFRQLMPSDPAGVETIGPILITPDGKTCVFGYHRMLSDLYLVEGLGG